MKAWQRWVFGVLAAVVALSGGSYCWMKYFIESSDPMAVVNHPWQPTMLHLHVLASPPFILMFGILLDSHIMKRLGRRQVPNRRSGLLSLGTFAVMVISGYWLEVVTNEAWLKGLVVAHIASGVVFSATYVIHLLISVWLVRAGRFEPAHEAA